MLQSCWQHVDGDGRCRDNKFQKLNRRCERRASRGWGSALRKDWRFLGVKSQEVACSLHAETSEQAETALTWTDELLRSVGGLIR